MAGEHAYEPLSVEDGVPAKQARKRRLHLVQLPAQLARSRLGLSLGLVFFGLLCLPILRLHLRPPRQADFLPAENPYFHTGEIWAHNDEVAARLDRCASLGLLRTTADPPTTLSVEEEARYASEGCGTNSTTIIILSSLWFAEAFSGSSNAGEAIYAQSVISTLNYHGYAYMFSSLGWWNHDMRKTSEIYHKHRANVRAVLADPEQVDVCWHLTEQKCVKTEENLDGIEAWRLLSFWYWDDPGNPLGAQFTLSPSPRNNNHFLSFSIEPTCHRLPFVPHSRRANPPQAYLLAKQVHYLDDTPAFSWTLPALVDLEREFGISVLGGMVDDDEATSAAVKAAGLTNLGRLGKMEFYEELASSFVLVGVGRPRISPSPWDALCMGLPFINPILEWDENDPSNRSKWHAQQWHMTDLDPPYVYSVKTHDLIGLRRAIHAALTHPIDSWIPDYMRFDFAAARMAEVVEADWRAKAEVILQDRVRTGQGELFIL
ncbi:hypothetical protein EHS25_007437 [Saitozyma podzolica]|uniref:Glycosyltransferase family 18 catalytic domain-containing protein n=1 Tax=Saitozyma podzolica TaxID=1890683 RepID=A0A427YPP2_9TREE|nr:hypothetical protein EHS25_007437 [Saitozyma podzolica]